VAEENNMAFSDIWESFIGYNPDEGNKNLLGDAFKKMGRNTTAKDVGNALVGAAAYQPNSGAAPLLGLAGKQIGAASSDWMKRLLTDKVGYLAPDTGGAITPGPGIAKDIFNVGKAGDIAFDWSKMMPSGVDLASAGLAAGLNLTGLDRTPVGAAVQLGAAGAEAAMQGFTNPYSDAKLVFQLFKTLGIL